MRRSMRASALTLFAALCLLLTEPAHAQSAPGAPTIGVVTRGADSLTINWSAPGNNGGSPITRYDLRYVRNEDRGETTDSYTTVTGIATTADNPYVLTGLSRGVRYLLQLRAVNAAGTGQWTLATRVATTDVLPSAPTKVNLTEKSTRLAVDWQRPEEGTNGITRYEIRAIRSDASEADKMDDSKWTLSSVTGHAIDRSEGTVTDLTNGVSYDVQVRARNALGDGPWSSTASGTPFVANQNPTFAQEEPVVLRVDENVRSGTRIGMPVTAQDPNGDRLTYSLTGYRSNSFAYLDLDLVASSGQLLSKAPLDYEGLVPPRVRLQVSDGKDEDGEPDSSIDDDILVQIEVNDINEVPSISGPTMVELAEGNARLVGSYAAVDPDLTDSAAWEALQGSDASAFELDDSGTLRFRTDPDYEARSNNVYRVRLVAVDSAALRGSLDVSVTVTDVDEPPLLEGPESVDFDEHATGLVTTFSANDPERRAVAWSLEGADASAFRLENGRLSFASNIVPNFETKETYAVTIVVRDGEHTLRRSLTVSITNLDEAGSLTLSILQPQVGSVLRATHADADGIESETWSWHRSPDKSTWTLIDAQTTNAYTPTSDDLNAYLRATVDYEDGHGAGKQREVATARTVRARPEQNEPPVFSSDLPHAINLPENTAPGTAVGPRFAAMDPDDDPLTYRLSGSDSALFSIDRETGQVRVAQNVILDYERLGGNIRFNVVATDPSNVSTSRELFINLQNLNEPPVAVDDTGTTREDQERILFVRNNDSDPEGISSVRVASVTQPRHGRARVDETNRRYVLYRPAPDFHGRDSFTYTISDGQYSATATVIVTVLPVDDAPRFPTGPIVRYVNPNAPIGTRVGAPVRARDVDGDPVTHRTYSSRFSIDPTTGQLTVTGDISAYGDDVESVTIALEAVDDNGNTAEAEVTIYLRGGGPFVGGGGGGGGGGAPPVATPSDEDFDWNVTRDIEPLDPDHETPTDLWSDGETLWILNNAQSGADAIFAYDLDTGERMADREFELDRRNRFSHGLWSDGEIAWIADSGQDRLFAYQLADDERVPDRDIELTERNRDPRGLWSDGQVLFVLDSVKDSLFLYALDSGEQQAEHPLDSLNKSPRGIWSDGVSIWISDDGANRVFAYRLEDDGLRRIEAEEFSFRSLLKAGNSDPRGIWSDGDVMYVVDEQDRRVLSYNMPDAIQAFLASLELSGLDIGEFDTRRRDYSAEVPPDLTETTVAAVATQETATITVNPDDADSETDGHQVALSDLSEIVVTVMSADRSRSRSYHVALEAAVVNRAPLGGEPETLELSEGGEPATLTLAQLFSDTDDDRLTFTVAEPQPAGVVRVTRSEGVLTIRPLTVGDATIRISASYGQAMSEPLTVRISVEASDAISELRIAARAVTGGPIEFGLQTRQSGGDWSERQLPRARFLLADAELDRWLASTPLPLGPEDSETAVRIVARRLADGHAEFGLQLQSSDGGWGERLLPRARFLLADAELDRWFASSPLSPDA